MTFDSDDSTVTLEAHPGWRARLIPDDAAAQPWGDALAPALLIPGRGKASFAPGVFQPAHADRILDAHRQLDDDARLERYLRIVHGTTTVTYVTSRDMTVMLFDTSEYRRHVGCPAPCDLSGEYAEWRAWLDGDVFGIAVEHDTGTADSPVWRECDAVWSFYGHEHACQRAADLITENATARRPVNAGR